ncbi:MAG: hypothetical protein Q9166_008111 [cf. Caloplaca sp. 2 TL-2023]
MGPKLGLGGSTNPSKIPIIAIATTLSGAEYIPFAGVTDDADDVKYQFTGNSKGPAVIVLSETLALTVPVRTWLASGDIPDAEEVFLQQGLTEEDNTDLGDLLNAFIKELGLPRSLSEVGVIGPEKLATLAQKSLKDPHLRSASLTSTTMAKLTDDAIPNDSASTASTPSSPPSRGTTGLSSDTELPSTLPSAATNNFRSDFVTEPTASMLFAPTSSILAFDWEEDPTTASF